MITKFTGDRLFFTSDSIIEIIFRFCDTSDSNVCRILKKYKNDN